MPCCWWQPRPRLPPRLSSTTSRSSAGGCSRPSCGVCHTRPTLVAGLYGPELNKDSAGGREETIRDVVTNGTPRMPGFKYTYNPDQIAAIAAYVKTLPVGNQALTVPPATRRQ